MLEPSSPGVQSFLAKYPQDGSDCTENFTKSIGNQKPYDVSLSIGIFTLRFRKSEKPLKLKKKIVSDFTQILCVYFLDHRDFKFLVSSQTFFNFFYNFLPKAQGIPKFLTSNFSNFLKKMSKVTLLGLGK